MLLPLFIFTAALTFPIPQLGNCQSPAECKSYCDVPWHRTVCESYAQQTELETDVLASVQLNYPIPELGSCSSKEECKAFCDLPDNYSVCTQFGEKHNLVKRKDSATPEQQIIDRLTYPITELDSCASKEECRQFCNNPENQTACRNFAEDTGLIPLGERPEGDYQKEPEEHEEEKKQQPRQIEFPIPELGNCGSIDECDAYCRTNSANSACQQYAEMTDMEEYYEEDFGEKEEPEDVSEGTEGINFPIAELDNCGSMEECAMYCGQPDHREQCTAFAQAHGMSTPQQQEEEQKKSGPGGCSSPEECKEYCKNNPQDKECQQAKEQFCVQYPERCKMKEHEMQKDMDKIKEGPGGCTSLEECKTYCEKHPDNAECKEMKPEPGNMEKKEKTGPGGCTSPEECIEYCKNNPTDPGCSEEMMEKVE